MINNGYLVHHGILGQKWGIRRYQNPDGTLTEAGKQRYGTMDPDKLQKQLHKDIKKARSKRSGLSNQWLWSNTIGENSKKALDNFENARKQNWDKIQKKLDKLDDDLHKGKIDEYEHEDRYEEILNSGYDPKIDASIVYRNGAKRVKEFVEGYGSDMNIGYLKDLGYSDDAAKYINKQLLKSKIKTIW